MNPLKTFCLIACLVAVASASPSKKARDNVAATGLKPSQWLSSAELQAVPSIDELTLEQLESMPLEQGAHLIEKLCKYSFITKLRSFN